jgi:hypothetical protein
MKEGPAPLPALRLDRFEAFTHFVATRQGLYVVNASRCALLADGAYFGLSLQAGDLYAFERGGDADGPIAPGRILRFGLNPDRDRVHRIDPVATGLDPGCHQIDFIGGRLHVVDTHRQRLVVYSPGFDHAEMHSPLPIAGSREAADPGYVHMNAIVARGRDLWLMLHHGGKVPSEIIQVDEHLAILQRRALGFSGCHDLVPLEDGDMLFCGSNEGVVASTGGRRAPVIPGLMTRGLSVDAQGVVVGSSVFGPRRIRAGLPGAVSFMTRDLAVSSHVAVPGSPTDILGFRADDLSLSR